MALAMCCLLHPHSLPWVTCPRCGPGAAAVSRWPTREDRGPFCPLPAPLLPPRTLTPGETELGGCSLLESSLETVATASACPG